MLSFRSQMKLIPEDLSNVASEGKLGKRHPDSISKTNGVEQVKCNPIKEAREHYKRKVFFFFYQKQHCNIINKDLKGTKEG